MGGPLDFALPLLKEGFEVVAGDFGFLWRKLELKGALVGGDGLVMAAEVAETHGGPEVRFAGVGIALRGSGVGCEGGLHAPQFVVGGAEIELRDVIGGAEPHGFGEMRGCLFGAAGLEVEMAEVDVENRSAGGNA